MKAKIGIKEESRSKIAQELAKLLADEFVLYTKTRNAHWNIEGPDFYNKHKLFEDQYTAIDKIVDAVAERIRTLGHYAPATLKDYLKLTQLTEASREKNDSNGFIKELLSDHESIIVSLRENIDQMATKGKDFGTSDFITGLMETHEKMAWMLRSHLRD
jgi:starvation-inducible DNA-binding protein